MVWLYIQDSDRDNCATKSEGRRHLGTYIVSRAPKDASHGGSVPVSCSDDSDSDHRVVHAASVGKQLSSGRFVHVRHGVSTPDSVLMSKPPHSDNVGHGHASSTPSSARCAWCTEHTGPGTAMGAALECRSSVINFFRLAQDAGMLPVNALL